MRSIEIARAAGVRIAAGTDIATTGEGTLAPWGANGQELPALAALGLTPLEAIEAATANGPATLGPHAPRAGQLAEGYDADVMTVSRNPVDDLALLGDPVNVTGVWKRGVAVKRA